MKRVFSQAAPKQAVAILAVLEQRHPGRLAALREDALAELGRWPEIQIRMVPETGGADRCSLAGSYDDTTEPPTLRVGESWSRRRRGFTALHELGHHLQQTDPALGGNLFVWRDSEGLEEEACDAFAACVLLPEAELSDALRRFGPTAAAVVGLFRSSQASREACCVRASEFFVGSGVVVLLDSEGRVVFAARHGMIPPAYRSDQSATPLIRAALKSRSNAQVDRTHILFRDGHRSDDLYGQAEWLDEDHLVAVLAPDQVAWRAFTAPRPESGTSRFPSWWTCEICGDGFPVTGICAQCQQPACPQGHCGCTVARAAADRTCAECYMTKAKTLFTSGSTVCKDCME
ncbi:ImmA/IrrE family metallo-endopeptidase [Peterkaempfera sp. SMS 1(5)a]|uniref:ImmA/IrrE family metallo-endopeptidase n=1 Tax=Peterkaempfera podocarpi TaxID=3232308 RepID=UPI00366C62E4